jgi:hypothetical protein
MARPPQRYIEPTEIYTDMRHGPDTVMPRALPYSWTPVNGLGAAEAAPALSIEDVLRAGQDVIDASTQAGKDAAKDQIKDLLNTTAGKQLLDAVEASAREGVVTEVKKNAPNLLLFAVAGGAVGGALSAKLGKTGTVLAIALAVWSGFQLMNPPPPSKG